VDDVDAHLGVLDLPELADDGRLVLAIKARSEDVTGDPDEVFDAVFDDLAVPSRSMGAPARVDVLEFEDDELMLTAVPEHYDDWELSDALDCDGVDAALDEADAICVQDWVSFGKMDEALRALADEVAGPTTVVIDPGDVTHSDAGALAGLGDALRAVSETHEVVLSLNHREMCCVLDAFALSGSLPHDRLERLRETLCL
jgi:hypothetical protein